MKRRVVLSVLLVWKLYKIVLDPQCLCKFLWVSFRSYLTLIYVVTLRDISIILFLSDQQSNTKSSCPPVSTWDEPQTKATKYKILPPGVGRVAHYVHTQQWRSNFYFIVNLPFVSGPLCCQTIQTSYLWWENVLRPISYYIVAHYNGADAIFNIVSKHLDISLNISKTISRNDWWVEVIVLYRGPAQCCTIDKIELTILPLCASFTLQTFTSPLSTATTTNQSRCNL